MRRSEEEECKKRWGKIIIRKRQMVKVMAKTSLEDKAQVIR